MYNICLTAIASDSLTAYFTYSISMQNDCGIINSISCLKMFIPLSNLEVSQVFLFLPRPVFIHVFILVGNFAAHMHIEERYFASLCLLINDRDLWPAISLPDLVT